MNKQLFYWVIWEDNQVFITPAANAQALKETDRTSPIWMNIEDLQCMTTQDVKDIIEGNLLNKNVIYE